MRRAWTYLYKNNHNQPNMHIYVQKKKALEGNTPKYYSLKLPTFKKNYSARKMSNILLSEKSIS